jgi:glycosyltransferase involved in cell wall biosynthesis
VVALGDAGDVRTWSGIPYHFYRAAEATGFLTGALDLPTERLRWRRLGWNLKSAALGDRPGGYQYSPSCLDFLFGSASGTIHGQEVISHFQLFPPLRLARRSGTVFSFYIDMPLRRLFDDYRIRDTIGRRIASDAIAREREGYLASRFVVCMSSWAAQSVLQEYRIPSEKVRVVLPGANMSDAIVEDVTHGLDDEPVPVSFDRSRPFRLGFTGMHPKRKGLPLLVNAAEVLRGRGYDVEIGVIGACPEEYRDRPSVRWIGYIDKNREMERFVRTVGSFDLGCLLSEAEGLGISTLEFLRLGVPVMGTAVGGITDCVPPSAGILVPGGSDAERVAAEIQGLLDDPARYAAMRRAARAMRMHYTWSRTVADFRQIWGLA